MKRAALIFGGSSGIGFGVAKSLISKGAEVLLVSRSQEKLDRAQALLRRDQETDIRTHAADISKEYELMRAIDWATTTTNIDILVNNTGGPPAKSYENIENTEWRECFDGVFMSAVIPTRILGPEMASRGWGRIVTIGSTVTKEPTNMMVMSSSIRSATTTYMKAISRELASKGVTVNTVAIGGVQTDRVRNLSKQIADKEGVDVEEVLMRNTATIPAKRLGTIEEIGSYVEFLCRDESGYITGTTLSIDGGLTRGVFL